MAEIRLETDAPEDTERLAARLAARLGPGSLVTLDGDLGAGKTTFTRGFARGLGLPDPRDVASPTYAIHHRYEGGRLPLDHLDLYRVEDALAAERQGLLDPILEPEGVTLVEWAERLPPGRMTARIAVRLEILGVARRGVVLSGADEDLATLRGSA